MSGGDLTPLLVPPERPDWGFRQGTIVAWDVFSGTGSVRVAGATLTDVPFLAQAGQVYYEAGDAVLLVRIRSSWAIVGRYVTPGGQAAIGRYTEMTGAYTATPVLGWSLSTSYVTKISLAVTVPGWAQVATGTASLMAIGRNSTAADDFLNARVLVNGANFDGLGGPAVTGKWGAVTALVHFQVVVTPGGTLTFSGQLGSSGAAWAANAANAAYLGATVAWNSNTG